MSFHECRTSTLAPDGRRAGIVIGLRSTRDATQLQLAGLSTKNKLFAGFDFGRISNNNPDPLLPRGNMTGYVVGLTSQVEKMSLDLFWTKAHSLPSTMKLESPQTWVRVSYSL